MWNNGDMEKSSVVFGTAEKVGENVFRTVIKAERSKIAEGSVQSEMPNFGYMVWSKDGSLLSEEQLQEKIGKGAKVVTALSGLDADPIQFEEIAKKTLEEYSGESELLVMGLACPGFWLQQYAENHELSVGDVSSDKYALMVLEWAKKMKLAQNNMVVLGHSAGGEAAVKLSKWFKVVALSPALHPDEDVTFTVISKGNILAKGVTDRAEKLAPAVNVVQKNIVALFSGSKLGSFLHNLHMERLLDGNGQSHDVKVVELCQKDVLPNFAPKPENLAIMGGDKDILTGSDKLTVWFNNWFREKRGDLDWQTSWKSMTEWFPEKIRRNMRHDTSVVDKGSIDVVSQKLTEMLDGLERLPIMEITNEDFDGLRAAAGVQVMKAAEIVTEMSRLQKLRSDFTLMSHREVDMVQYLDAPIYGEMTDFLTIVNSLKNQEEFDTWLKSSEGNKMLLSLTANMLARGRNDDGTPMFEEPEIERIRSGELPLTDTRIRARVAEFPIRNEWYGWMTVDEMQTSEFRGRGSRGDTLDPALYLFTDIILRRIPGMGAEDESIWELMSNPLKFREGDLHNKLKTWYEWWILAKNSFNSRQIIR